MARWFNLDFALLCAGVVAVVAFVLPAALHLANYLENRSGIRKMEAEVKRKKESLREELIAWGKIDITDLSEKEIVALCEKDPFYKKYTWRYNGFGQMNGVAIGVAPIDWK